MQQQTEPAANACTFQTGAPSTAAAAAQSRGGPDQQLFKQRVFGVNTLAAAVAVASIVAVASAAVIAVAAASTVAIAATASVTAAAAGMATAAAAVVVSNAAAAVVVAAAATGRSW